MKMDNPNLTETENHTSLSRPKLKFPPLNIFSLVRNIFASAQNIIGIDIGSHSIKLLQLQKSAKGYAITSYITRTITQAVKDKPQEKKRIVKEFVKEFIAEARIKTTLGRIAIWGKGVFIFSLNVPLLNKKDLRGAVSMELKKRLPFQLSLENISFDFFVTGQTRDEKGLGALQVTCVACDRLLLEEQVELLKEMGIRPIAVNVIADALGNILPYCVETPATKTAALLDSGANSSTLNFYRGRDLVFSREIPIGGEHFTHAMTRSISTSTGPININAEDAERIKRQCGIPLEEEAKTEFLTDFGILSGEQISTMLRPTLERMVMEINRTFTYYASTFKTYPADELYLTGGNSRLKNLPQFLAHNLQGLKKVEPLNALKAAKTWKDNAVFKQELVMEQAAPHLSCAFGLCLGSGGKINLLPAKEKLEQKAAFLSIILKISFPLILSLNLLYYAVSFIGARNYKKLIKDTTYEIKKLAPASTKAREYLEIKTKLDERKKLLEQASGSQPLWHGVFKELSNITPKEVILSKITMVENKEPKELRVAGKIFSKYTIVDLELSQYLMVLGDSPFFSNVQLVSSEQDMYSPIPAANFEIVCRMKY